MSEYISKEPKVNVLPVCNPMITTYTQHAHLLSILTNYEQTYQWIFGNYIQLYINKDYKINWGDFYFPATNDTRPSDTCKWLISQKIHRDIVATKWESVIDFIIECIDLNNYVHTMINYFYVPVSDRFNKLHMHHDVFIYGYDLSKEILYVSDFFREGKYSRETISFSDFSLAFSTYNLTKNPDYLNEMIYLYKFNDDYKNIYKFSFDSILNSIKNYLFSSVPEYWDIYDYEGDKCDKDFGMGIYSTLKNYAKDISNSETSLFDIRPFYLLYDHKRIMTLRLEYLYKQGYLAEFDSDNIMRYSEVEANARDVVNVVVKYDVQKDEGRNNKNLIEILINILNNIEKEESEILKLLF